MASKITSTIARSNLIKRSAFEWHHRWSQQTRIGITKNFIHDLGKVNFIEYAKPVGNTFNKGDFIAFVENDKGIVSLEAPFDCQIVDIPKNTDALINNINHNSECKNKSWIVSISDISEIDILYAMAMI